ncbi:hypothetical protein NDU88_011021 [Pleurodeles waltl]|uniref:Uncharacterized protein n=1 Tax=Pleurodeles waltl TaxID=8319 RepID=A0AAV7R0D9_PLEWA|nr:hypothetical protein NDU88_011021 [Pleurodeles waltl]
MSNTCADSVHGVPDTPRRAGLPIGSPQCSQEGGAIIRTAGIMPGCPFQRRRTEEPTSKRTTETGEEHDWSHSGRFPALLGRRRFGGSDTLAIPTP